MTITSHHTRSGDLFVGGWELAFLPISSFPSHLRCFLSRPFLTLTNLSLDNKLYDIVLFFFVFFFSSSLYPASTHLESRPLRDGDNPFLYQPILPLPGCYAASPLNAHSVQETAQPNRCRAHSAHRQLRFVKEACGLLKPIIPFFCFSSHSCSRDGTSDVHAHSVASPCANRSSDTNFESHPP